MITCNLMGGLGNQLFQIFTTICYAIQNKQPFKFANITTLGKGNTTIRHTYWETFLSRLKPFLMNPKDFPNLELIKEDGFNYRPIPFVSSGANICLYGYYQTYKYFNHSFNQICKMIQLEEMKANVIKKLDYNIYNNYFFNQAISFHFRLGDYKKVQHVHPIMNIKYYEDSLKYIQERRVADKNVLYFCEEEDIKEVSEIIDSLKATFPKYQFIRADNELEDWEQLLLMSCCRYNVIANSTFSWWGAYFNSDSKKTVIYPSVWFGPNVKYVTDDLFPSEWIKMEVVVE